MPKDENKEEMNLNKYKDRDGLSLKRMNFGLWLSESRAKIMKIIIIFLIVLSAFFFVYSSYNYIIYFLTSANNKDEISLVDTGILSPRQVSELIIGTPQVFRSGGGYDMAVSLKNPNDKYSGTYSFCFYANETDIKCSSDFILPGEEKYATALGQKIDDQAVIGFKITNINWQRFDNRKIPNWATFANEHLNFRIENLNLVLAERSGLSEKIGLDLLSFSIVNNTNFGYYEVPLLITFYSGEDLVGVNSYLLKNFKSGETKFVRLSWPGGLGNISRTEIRPYLNILDDNIYLNYQGAQ